MRFLILISLSLAVGAAPDLAFSQKESVKELQRRIANSIQIVKTIESLRSYCAKPLDQFETHEVALDRALKGFQPPQLEFVVRPLLVPPVGSTKAISDPNGGQIVDGTIYDLEKQQLLVEYPFYRGGSRRLSSDAPFKESKVPPKFYSLLEVASEYRNLSTYRAANAYGVTMDVTHSTETHYNFIFAKNSDFAKLDIPRDTKKVRPSLPIPMDAERARAVAPELEWRIKVQVEHYPGSTCLVDKIEYTNRMPVLDNPWKEDKLEYFVPVRLGSIKLVNRRTGEVFWTAENTIAHSTSTSANPR